MTLKQAIVKNIMGRPPTYPRLIDTKSLAKNLRVYGEVWVKDLGRFRAMKHGKTGVTRKSFYSFTFSPNDKFMEEFNEETAE